jgi:hypothetical protein
MDGGHECFFGKFKKNFQHFKEHWRKISGHNIVHNERAGTFSLTAPSLGRGTTPDRRTV